MKFTSPARGVAADVRVPSRRRSWNVRVTIEKTDCNLNGHDVMGHKPRRGAGLYEKQIPNHRQAAAGETRCQIGEESTLEALAIAEKKPGSSSLRKRSEIKSARMPTERKS